MTPSGPKFGRWIPRGGTPPLPGVVGLVGHLPQWSTALFSSGPPQEEVVLKGWRNLYLVEGLVAARGKTRRPFWPISGPGRLEALRGQDQILLRVLPTQLQGPAERPAVGRRKEASGSPGGPRRRPLPPLLSGSRMRPRIHRTRPEPLPALKTKARPKPKWLPLYPHKAGSSRVIAQGGAQSLALPQSHKRKV